MSMPAQYLFKDIPRIEGKEDFVAWTVQEMDRHGIPRAMPGIDDGNEGTKEALRDEVWPQFLRDNALRVIKL